MAETDIESWRRHAILAQFHRWFLLYERPEGGIDNALDLLASDARIVSGLGETTGHEQYRGRVASLPADWRNAHFARDIAVRVGEDGTERLSASVLYLNRGMLEGGAVRCADLTYHMTFGPDPLPKIASVEIVQNGEDTAERFADAYAENRVRSLMHRWFSLVDDPGRDPEAAAELLAPEHRLRFLDATVTSEAEAADWMRVRDEKAGHGEYRLRDFTAREVGENRYAMTVVLDWQGALPDGTEMVAKTKQAWSVQDDPTERFARIRSIEATVVEPLRPAKA